MKFAFSAMVRPPRLLLSKSPVLHHSYVFAESCVRAWERKSSGFFQFVTYVSATPFVWARVRAPLRSSIRSTKREKSLEDISSSSNMSTAEPWWVPLNSSKRECECRSDPHWGVLSVKIHEDISNSSNMSTAEPWWVPLNLSERECERRSDPHRGVPRGAKSWGYFQFVKYVNSSRDYMNVTQFAWARVRAPLRSSLRKPSS